jgi:hypothetical protein
MTDPTFGTFMFRRPGAAGPYPATEFRRIYNIGTTAGWCDGLGFHQDLERLENHGRRTPITNEALRHS